MYRWVLAGLVAGVLAMAGHAGWAAEEAAPAPKDATVTPKDPAAQDAVFTERLKEIRLIEIRNLRSNNDADFQEGRKKILALNDDTAVGPLVQVLYGPNARYRGLLVEALSQFASRNSQAAAAYLQEIAVGDGSQGHRRRAVEGLRAGTGKPPTDRLLFHLAEDEVSVGRDRAATALATLDEKRAVWLMVERLVTEEARMVGAEVYDCQVTLDVRTQQCEIPTFRRYQITGAVGGALVGGVAQFTIELPETQVADAKTTISMADHHVIPDIQRTQVQHPEVLAALKALTGKDFGYNQAAWQKWLQSPEGGKIIPAWQPIIVKVQ